MLMHTSRPVTVVAIDGRDEPKLLALAASLARGLESPLAAAILESARERDIQVEEIDRFDDTTGAGVAASVAGHTVVLRNSALFDDLGLSMESLGEWPERLRRQGQHVLVVAVDGRPAGFLGIVDASARGTVITQEDNMKATSDHFPRETAGLSQVHSTETFELADGDQFDLHIAPVTKKLGGATVRMLAYNGSIPGPTLRVRQGPSCWSTSSMMETSRRQYTGTGYASRTATTGLPRLSVRSPSVADSGTGSHSRTPESTGTTRTSARTTARRWASTATSWSFPRSRTTGLSSIVISKA